MDNETLIHICGWVASIGLILGYLPQAIQTIRTRKTDGISLPGFIMMAIGCLAFVIQGILIGNIYLLITNLITFVCSVIIFGIKMYNDYFKKDKKK
jgi:MtN3 and saliva related transmembrane protein